MVPEGDEQSPDGGQEETPFGQLADKTLLSAVHLASWCPTMDLLAMAMADGQLVVHRLNWQRLWSVTTEHKVTSLCWQPNGKVLAAGQTDGAVVLYNVEDGEVHHELAAHEAEVTALEWVEEEADAPVNTPGVFSYTDRTSRFFPPCPPPPQGPGSTPLAAFDLSGGGEPGSSPAEKAGGSPPLKLNMLCSADRQGVITLHALGSFLIGKVRLREVDFLEPMEPGKFTGTPPQRIRDANILKISLSPDLRHLSIFTHGTLSGAPVTTPGRPKSRSPPAPRPVQAAPGVYMLAVDSGLLGDRKKELLQVALQASNIATLLTTAEQTLEAMIKQWTDAYAAWQKRLRELVDILNRQERDGFQANPRDEFLALLSCGLATAGLHQFLTSAMGEQGVKRLAKTMDVASANIHAYAAETLQPVLEVLTFRLGELRGLARWRARMGPIGVIESDLEEALQHSGQMMIHTERLLRKTAALCAEYRVFFTWLLRCIKTLNQEPLPAATAPDALPPVSTQAVAHFLQPKFDEDPLGGILNATFPAKKEESSEEEEILAVLAAMGGYKDTSLLRRSMKQHLTQLQDKCQAAVSLVPQTVSSALQITSTVLLSPSDASDKALLSSSFVKARSATNAETSTSMQEARPWEYWCMKVAGQKANPSSQQQPVLLLRRRLVKSSHVSDPDWLPTESAFDPETLCFEATPSSSHHWKDAHVKARHVPQKATMLPYDERDIEAVALTLGKESRVIVDLEFYKDGEIALLVREDTAGARSWLMLLPTDDLPFASVGRSLAKGEQRALLAHCLETEAIRTVDWTEGRVRELSLQNAIAPLAVSGNRGVACVFAGQRRILLFDLEDTETNEDD